MNKRLIVNADGFGFGTGATQGIFDALEEGKFITSVSVNANFQEAERVSELSSKYPHISIGVHLNPMVGKPCLHPQRVPSLVGQDGYFHGHKFTGLLRKNMTSLDELEVEFDAQISKIKDLVGDHITHLDSQGNKHLIYFDLFLKLAQKWGIKRIRNNAPLICLESLTPFCSRIVAYLKHPHLWIVHKYRRYQMLKARKLGIRMVDNLITVGYAGTGNKTNPDNWERILRNMSSGTYEIYCHPAYPDKVLRRWALYYCEERLEELTLLRKDWLANVAKYSDVKLISFNDI